MRYLWYQQQHFMLPTKVSVCCELLSKWGIFDISNNISEHNLCELGLWIAFKMRYLWYQQQQLWFWFRYSLGCELLSKWGIFDISNNSISRSKVLSRVVNCFQNEVSLISATTQSSKWVHESKLWIAFKMRYLWYQQQHGVKIISTFSGCELLSKWGIFDISNNSARYHAIINNVVNCFQNEVSLISATTGVYWPYNES